MTRKEQIKKALLASLESITPEIESNFDYGYGSAYMHAFHEGAEWADANPHPLSYSRDRQVELLMTQLAIAVEAFEYLSTCPEPFVVSQINGGEYVTLSGYANAVLVELKKGDKK